MVTEIQSCLQNKQVNFHHILREENKVADHVANFAIDRRTCTFTNFNNMETDARRLVNNDKLLCPYIKSVIFKGIGGKGRLQYIFFHKQHNYIEFEGNKTGKMLLLFQSTK